MELSHTRHIASAQDVMTYVAYIQPVAQGGQLLLEHVDNTLASLATVWNVNWLGGTSCNLNHLLKGGVFERLNGL